MIFPPLVVDKIVLSIFVICFPLSIRYVLNSINHDSNYLSVLAFPFIYNYPFQMGFFNFSYGIIVLLIILGYWVKHHDNLKIINILFLSLLSTILYFSHLLSLAILYALIIAYEIAYILIDSKDGIKTIVRDNFFNWDRLENGLKKVIPFFTFNYLKRQLSNAAGRKEINMAGSTQVSRFFILSFFDCFV